MRPVGAVPPALGAPATPGDALVPDELPEEDELAPELPLPPEDCARLSRVSKMGISATTIVLNARPRLCIFFTAVSSFCLPFAASDPLENGRRKPRFRAFSGNPRILKAPCPILIQSAS